MSQTPPSPSTLPVPPVDVRLLLEGGTDLAVDCVPSGVEDGNWVWDVIIPAWLDHSRVRSVHCAVLPAHTVLRIPV